MSIYAQLWFDTEDFITPESDDALYLLLVMLKEKNIPATIKLVAEKARMLERRSRYDIIGLLKSCDNIEIGYHTDTHSIHPTISEYCELMGFSEGYAAFYARENPGRLDVERITGKKCVCYGQPGNSWSPQAFPALMDMDIPVYMDCHDVIGGRHGVPYRFGGLLNYLNVPYFRMELSPDYQKNITKAREEFKTQFEGKNAPRFINIFYHPCEFSCTEFYDLNFAEGKNPPREHWKPAKLRPSEEMRGLVKNLGEFLDFLLEQNVKIISVSELILMLKPEDCEIPEDMMNEIIEKASSGLVDYLKYGNYSVSAVESLSLLARKTLNRPLICSFAFGPERDFKSTSKNPQKINPALLAGIVCGFFDNNTAKPAVLPDYFEVSGEKISPLDTAVLLAQSIGGEYKDTKNILCPAELVTKNEDWSGWIIHKPGFKVHNILELAKLQMWTFKF
ncbi:MAG: hypothetical protein FWH24_03275 [Oscillospiraceae bacterium]|nr:hypothetical protein [Oscillospiraceae bacterium]